MYRDLGLYRDLDIYTALGFYRGLGFLKGPGFQDPKCMRMGAGSAPWMEAEQATSALSQETMELQWAAYVQRLREGGALSSAMAVCDVSGSMMGQPMEVSRSALTQEWGIDIGVQGIAYGNRICCTLYPDACTALRESNEVGPLNQGIGLCNRECNGCETPSQCSGLRFAK